MKYKSIFSLIIGTLITLPVCSADNDIDLHKKGDSQTGSRSITTECVYAYIDNGTLLNITYNGITPSRIRLYETPSNNIVWDYEYSPSCSIQANIELLPNGIYMLEISAFGQYWIGYIEIEN